MEKGTRQLTDRETDRISGTSITLQTIGKNVQPLQTELREEELLTELQTITWDILLLSETWRDKKQER